MRAMNWFRLTLRRLRSLLFLAIGCFSVLLARAAIDASQPSARDRNSVARKFDALPLSFEPNQGQFASDAKFLARGRGFSVLFKKGEVDFLLAGRTRKFDQLRVTLPNASQRSLLTAGSRLPGTVNYINGNNHQDWHTGVPTFERLRYAEAYPGIDLIYYGRQGRLEFDFQVSPGADPKSIRMRFAGAQRVRLDHNGDLLVAGKSGEIRFQKPTIYQQLEQNRKSPIAGRFRILDRNTIGFEVAQYDRTRLLIIDPILNYSTYIGTQAEPRSIAVDQNGEAYITGIAALDFPTTPGSYQPVGVPSSQFGNLWPESGKPFIAKFNSTGTALLYSTFLSGSGIDAANGIALDANGDAFIAGSTSSTDFPITPGALQTTTHAVGGTGFVAELNETGTSLLYSTYLGGSTATTIYHIALDTSGNAYVTGGTEDVDFPTTAGAYDATAIAKATSGLTSAFVSKLNPNGTVLVYSTYLGGNQQDTGSAIAVDSTGAAYVGGNTTSNNFPVTPGAAQGSRKANNQRAGFVIKLNAGGSALVYSTYLGGSDLDSLNAIALDTNGNAYAAGETNSPDFPVTSGAFQTSIGISSFGYPQVNAFVTELNSNGTSLLYSTFLGGGVSLFVYANGGDGISGIAVDGQGMLYLTGKACTGNFPVTAGAFESQNLDGEYSAECTGFLTKMNPTPNTPLLYSTFIGGTGGQDPPPDGLGLGDAETGVSLDPLGNVYVTGYTESVDFPVTSGVIDTPFIGPSEEGTVTEFNISEMKSLPVPKLTLTSNLNSVLFGQPVTFTATVQPASGSNAPSGYVAFNFLDREEGDDYGSGVGFGPWTTVALNGSGVATFTTSSLKALQTPVNAFYLGDANNAPATGTMTQTVVDIPTTTTLTSSQNNVPYGTPVVFTATILDNTGKPANGDVYFLLGNISYGYSAVNSAGQATWTNGTGGAPLPAGTDTIEAEFFPNTGYQTSSGTLAETFTILGTTPDPAIAPPAGTYSSPQSVSLSDANPAASIYYTTDGGAPVPGSSLQFFSGMTIPVNISERIKALAVAPGYSPSNIVSAAFTINLPPPGFTIAGTSVSLVAGATTGNTSTISLKPTGGFAGTVSLSCAITPTAPNDSATCSVPASVSMNGLTTQTITLTVTTAAATSALVRPAGLFWSSVGGAALACVVFIGVPARRRRWGAITGLFFLLWLGIAGPALGCGGSNAGGGGGTARNTGTTPGAYTITVTGTSGTITQTATISLTVQ
jgi:hypothetical protein